MADTDRKRAAERIAVTGIGAVCALGWDRRALWEGLQSPVTAIGPFDRFDASRHRTRLAAQVPSPRPPLPAGARPAGRISWADRFALHAACEALEHAGLRLPLSGAGTVGVYFGSSTGGMFEAERYYRSIHGGSDTSRPRVSLLSALCNGAPAAAVARFLGLRGPVETISSACASATMALGCALDDLRAGEVDVALAGGSDSLCELTYAGFNSLRAVASSACRPFRADREGLSLGEGAAVLVLEREDDARRRGAPALAELAGYAASCDAHHMTAPEAEGSGAAAAIRDALADAALPPGDVDFVNAHGTGTPQNDAAEWNALRTVFGERAGEIPLTATKGHVGHLLGSCGAVEAAATVLCLEAGLVTPAAQGGEVDPAIPVDLVRDGPRRLERARGALSVNLGFGGANAAVVFAAMGRR